MLVDPNVSNVQTESKMGTEKDTVICVSNPERSKTKKEKEKKKKQTTTTMDDDTTTATMTICYSAIADNLDLNTV